MANFENPDKISNPIQAAGDPVSPTKPRVPGPEISPEPLENPEAWPARSPEIEPARTSPELDPGSSPGEVGPVPSPEVTPTSPPVIRPITGLAQDD